jgi:hypothetical protein
MLPLRASGPGTNERRIVAGAAVALAVAIAGIFSNQGPVPVIASSVVAVAASLFAPQLAFALFVTSGVWKTAAVFGPPDSLLPTAALLLGWSASVVLHGDVRGQFVRSIRVCVVILPLVVWLFVSTFISHSGPEGYREALRFIAVVMVPCLLVALDMRRGRLLAYAWAIFVSGTLLSLVALGGAVLAGNLWTKELLLFGENAVVFGRAAGIGFVAGLCLVPLSRRGPVSSILLYCGILLCATAVAHSTSRSAAIAAVLSGMALIAVVLLHRNGLPRGQALRSVLVLVAASAFLLVSATTFFPTGRGVQTLTALPSELPQFVQVPLLAQSLPTSSPTSPASASPLAASPAPSVSVSPAPSHSPDPAKVYESDLSLAYRIERYRIAAAQFMASPLTGIGYTRGIYSREGQDYAHNIFLEVASELGLVGLACLAIPLLALARALVRKRSSWELGMGAALLLFMFIAAQTSGNLTINRLFFVLCIALLGYASTTALPAASRELAPAGLSR